MGIKKDQITQAQDNTGTLPAGGATVGMFEGGQEANVPYNVAGSATTDFALTGIVLAPTASTYVTYFWEARLLSRWNPGKGDAESDMAFTNGTIIFDSTGGTPDTRFHASRSANMSTNFQGGYMGSNQDPGSSSALVPQIDIVSANIDSSGNLSVRLNNSDSSKFEGVIHVVISAPYAIPY